jgi:hypothetical protein
VSSGPASSSPQLSIAYHPPKSATYLETETGPFPGTITEVVTATSSEFTIERHSSNPNFIPIRQVFSVRPNGVYLIAQGSCSLHSAIVAFPNPLVAGFKWHVSVPTDPSGDLPATPAMATLSGTVQIVGTATISVAGRTISTVRIDARSDTSVTLQSQYLDPVSGLVVREDATGTLPGGIPFTSRTQITTPPAP